MSEIIFMEDDKAAEYKEVKVKGWVANGLLFSENERAARLEGMTHKECNQCGMAFDKKSFYTLCPSCLAKSERDRYSNLAYEKWDGKTPMALYDSDEYFYDEYDVDCYCEENDCDIGDLMLVLCVSQTVHELEMVDIYNDILPEDGDESSFPQDVVDAFDNLNKVISENKEPVSWWAGNIRTSV